MYFLKPFCQYSMLLVKGLCLLFFLSCEEENYGLYEQMGEHEQDQFSDFFDDPDVEPFRNPSYWDRFTGHVNNMMRGPTRGALCLEQEQAIQRMMTGPRIDFSDIVTELGDMPGLNGPVNTYIPSPSDSEEAREMGYYTYSHDWKRFATERTAWRLKAAGKKLAEDDIVMGIGNISKEGGGHLEPHQTHRQGLDVDFRFIGPSGRAQRCNINNANVDSCYDVEKTFQMVKTLIDVDPGNVKTIYINDPTLRDLVNDYYEQETGQRGISEPCPGHDDHIHFSWSG